MPLSPFDSGAVKGVPGRCQAATILQDLAAPMHGPLSGLYGLLQPLLDLHKPASSESLLSNKNSEFPSKSGSSKPLPNFPAQKAVIPVLPVERFSTFYSTLFLVPPKNGVW